MKHKIAIAAAAVAALLFWLLGLTAGYLLDPALHPLGFLYPVLAILLAASALLIGAIYGLGCLTLYFLGRGRQNLGLGLLALIGPAVVLGGPRLFSAYDAAVYRLKGIPETEYHRLAADVVAELEAQGVRMLSGLPAAGEAQIPLSLVESHRILTISRFPPRILAGDRSVSVSWGSGLTGGYTIAISQKPQPPAGWADALRQGDYDLPVTYIYGSVVVVLLP